MHILSSFFLRILQTFVSNQWRKINVSDVEKQSKYSYETGFTNVRTCKMYMCIYIMRVFYNYICVCNIKVELAYILRMLLSVCDCSVRYHCRDRISVSCKV